MERKRTYSIMVDYTPLTKHKKPFKKWYHADTLDECYQASDDWEHYMRDTDLWKQPLTNYYKRVVHEYVS